MDSCDKMSSSNLLALQPGLDGVQWEEGNIHRYSSTATSNILNSVADPKHNNADPDSSFNSDGDPDPASHQSDATRRPTDLQRLYCVRPRPSIALL